MKVLQLIDSLDPGGAENMSVAYANALAKRIEGSFLCCTRKEGALLRKVQPEVGYLFLKKKSTLDFKALLRLRQFILKNDIECVQAHGSSWFLGGLVKLIVPGVILVWHDHYGRDLERRSSGFLKIFSHLFSGIISVNSELREWAFKKLGTIHIRFIPNFLPDPAPSISSEDVRLKGGTGFKIICVANIRPQKDHLNLLRAFEMIVKDFPDISLHLVGKEVEGRNLKQIKEFIINQGLCEKVHFYGEQEEVLSLLGQADMGVLASSSEGLPVVLLEYGRAGLPVVATAVGEIPRVVGMDAQLAPPKAPIELARAIRFYLQNDLDRERDAKNFQTRIQRGYSEEKVIPELIHYFSEIMKMNGNQNKPFI